VEHQIEAMFGILIMAFALGMDAFSLSIGIGLTGLNRRKAIQLCSAVGFFHVALTLIGVYLGLLIGGLLGQVAEMFGALLLIGLGIHMAYSTLFSKPEEVKPLTTLYLILLISAGVSLDALSVGFTLGLRSAAYCLVAAAVFGVMGSVLCGAGLFVGKRASRYVGAFGEMLGALILIGLGLHFILD
jgi:manganese efflux pump family protein